MNIELSKIQEIVKPLLNNVVVAVIILVIGLIAGKLLGKVIQKTLHDLEIDKILKKASGISISLEKTLSGIATYFIYFISVIMALNQFNITTLILDILSAGIIIIIFIGFLLGIKDLLPNFFASLFIHQKDLIKKGDYIEINETKGKVIEIDMVETKIETNKGDVIFIPNSLLIKSILKKKKEE